MTLPFFRLVVLYGYTVDRCQIRINIVYYNRKLQKYD